MSADTKYDEVLLSVAGQCGGIAPLLDTFFSFLYRNTDFFHVMADGDKMGFQDGVAEKLVLRAFLTYQIAAAKARAEAGGPALEASAGAGKRPSAAAEVPAAATAPPRAPASSSGASSSSGAGAQPQRVAPRSEAATTMPHVALGKSPALLDDYNGGRTERYTWEQTLNDVTLAVPVPEGTRARDVVCVIKKGALSLKLRGTEASLVEGRYPCDARNGVEVWETVRVDDCTWSLGKLADGSLAVNLYLEKSRESWWKSAIEGDEVIDTTKVDSSRSVYDYDGETQGAIRKILFDQAQQRKGLPSSDELKNEEMLRRAWDAEGSPFQGTPFDLSKVNFKQAGAEGVPGMPQELGSGE